MTTGKFTKSHDIVKNYWLAQIGTDGDKEQAWRKALHDGVVAGSKTVEPVKVTVDAKKLGCGPGGGDQSRRSGN